MSDMLQLVVSWVNSTPENRSREYPQRQLGDGSRPAYNSSNKKFDAPRIQLVSFTQVRSRRVRGTRGADGRPDLKRSPTAVGGIRGFFLDT
ncbi:MAG TPA: hypothetical protein VL866_06700, partial [Pyrinomonadaceae bacterium]|nr:hypothetical protein [Pyrinomonadaceae bacterium]